MHYGYWDIDWLWSLPLIAISVVVHVIGLIFRGVVNTMRMATARRRFVPIFIAVIGRAALLATLLRLEAGLWAVAYRGLGALADGRTAMLYSLSAMTSYCHALKADLMASGQRHRLEERFSWRN